MFFGKTGSPDFYIFFDGGVIHLECKTPGEIQTDEQIAWQESISKLANNYYYVVENLLQFENVVNIHHLEKVKCIGNA